MTNPATPENKRREEIGKEIEHIDSGSARVKVRLSEGVVEHVTPVELEAASLTAKALLELTDSIDNASRTSDRRQIGLVGATAGLVVIGLITLWITLGA